MAILAILMLIIKRIYCYNTYEETVVKIRKYFDRDLFKEMSRFAGWGLLTNMMAVVTNQGKTILVNMFFGTAINAAQGVASQVVGQVGAFSNVLLKALNPAIVKSEGEGNRILMQRLSLSGSKFSYFLFLMFAVPIIVEMPFIFNIWLVDIPQFAIEFCRITLLTWTLGQLTITLTTAIAAKGVIKNYSITQSVVSLIPFLFSILFYYLGFSPLSMYYIYLVYTLISAGIILKFASILCGVSIINYLSDVVFRSLVVGLLVFGFSLIPIAFLNQGLMRLFFVFGISLISFFFFTITIGLSKFERNHLLNYLKSKNRLNTRIKKWLN
jgi:hypothetical protein